MKINPREKRRHATFFSLPAACRLFSRGVIFTRARVSLALLSLRKNGGLLVVYNREEAWTNTPAIVLTFYMLERFSLDCRKGLVFVLVLVLLRPLVG